MAKPAANKLSTDAALSSMTGFARAEGSHAVRRWTWELRSVNGRGLEMRFRLPPGHDSLEPDLRKAVSALFARGSLNMSLNLEKMSIASALRINDSALEETLRMIETVQSKVDCEKPRAEAILSLRGVIEADEGADDEEARAALSKAIIDSFGEAVQALKAARDAEGAKLGAIVSGQIDEIERLAGAARANAAVSPEAVKDRIAAQLGELLGDAGLPEERLTQEAAILAIKADVREELDRLDAHVSAARALLTSKEASGRRFDFLTQEFNREANTLCSKAQDMGLKRIGLDLKTVIDQMREQIQNIE